MRQLHPRAIWLFFLRNLLLTIFVVFGYLIIAWALSNFRFFLPSALPVAVLVGLLFAYLWAVLQRHFYRYDLTDTGFQKEYGVIYKRYVTIPYGRIQNIDIYRGLIHRTLGLSDLYIQTAGSSYTGTRTPGVIAEGQVPGVLREEAESVRNELIKRVSMTPKQGL